MFANFGVPGTGENSDDGTTSQGAGVESSALSRCLAGELDGATSEGIGQLSSTSVDQLRAALDVCDTSVAFDGLIAALVVPDRKFAIQDLEQAGFKTNKTYDITDLAGAVEAFYGFYGIDPYKRADYEVRLYPSHTEAIGPGVDFADEATGTGAVLSEEEQRWDIGLKERRQCTGVGGHHSGLCQYPKYADYVVVGNMVLLCQGKEPVESLLACTDLLSVVR